MRGPSGTDRGLREPVSGRMALWELDRIDVRNRHGSSTACLHLLASPTSGTSVLHLHSETQTELLLYILVHIPILHRCRTDRAPTIAENTE